MGVNTTTGQRRVWRRKVATTLNTQSMLAHVPSRDQLVYWAWMGTPEASHLCAKWCVAVGRHVKH